MISEKMLELLTLVHILDCCASITSAEYNSLKERYKMLRDEFIKEQLQYPIIKNPVTDIKSDECS
jgi:hypothetical protein